ncbi:Na+/H+ antiporter [Alkalicoccobacillus plakortidis]|uniref:Na+/H+ antiporter n=1 Tax=Alkalicoccobacillus plakortidis TaxID=444060 RepID=A0ABT0XG20_9BACI|nr:Na+/H+ antiporter [Alkalicoccobacillus plakortidis]MCM2674174.1 Na+/H+ antiporter [Alkalicoccobacillus plakortidis]
MDVMYTVLLLFFIIGLSNVIQRFVPFVPLPLVQIAIGVVISISPSGLHIPLEPELFFVLFIAPLLFNDGKVTPRDELWKLRRPILLLALGLVFATVVVGGTFIHFLIPSIPLPAAFALAAILSPTDVVAVGSIASRMHMPKGIMRLLEGEGLMNDASGLVAFKFAVAATVTGFFSIYQATGSFLLIAIGGLVSGALLALFIIWIKVLLRRFGLEDITVHMLIQIMTPFVIYILAEELGFSGILAVVAAGVVHAIERERSESRTLELQKVSDNTWSVILYILNGLVFVLLGLQVPDASRVVLEDPTFGNGAVIAYIFAITLVLLALRFVWLTLFWKKIKPLMTFKESDLPKFRAITTLTVSGVRGAVTLAGAFSIPYVISGGSPFPERDLIIFLAAGTILLTLIIASIFLPILAKQTAGESGDQKLLTFEQAADRTWQEGRSYLQKLRTADNRLAIRRLAKEYSQASGDVVYGGGTSWDFAKRRKEQAVRLKAMQTEHRLLIEELKTNKEELAESVVDYLQLRLQMIEEVLSNKTRFSLFAIRLKRLAQKVFPGTKHNKLNQEDGKKVREILARVYVQIIGELQKGLKTEENHAACMNLIPLYERVLHRISETDLDVDPVLEHQVLDLHYQVMEEMRRVTQQLFQENSTSRETTQNLRRYLNYVESAVAENAQTPVDH